MFYWMWVFFMIGWTGAYLTFGVKQPKKTSLFWNITTICVYIIAMTIFGLNYKR
jgi:hypothetical protein